MDVCFLINQVAPGGAPTLLLDIIRNTEDPDISYTLCVIEGDRSLVDEFEDAGAEVIDFRAAFKFDPRALYRMFRFFQRREFDILHVHLPYAQALGRFFGSLGGHRTIVSTQHNVPDYYHPVTRSLEQVTRPLNARAIAVSEGVERSFTGESCRFEPGQQRKWCTIYNGIDVDSFHQTVMDADPQAVRDRWSIDAEFIYLNISRYVEAKAQVDLVAGMSDVVEAEPDSHLLIVGWGPLEDELRTAVESRGLEEYVTVTGKVPTVHEYYALADVFVSSSIFEGMPIAHIEAMAAELPLVATDISGVNEVVVDGENGLLVPPERPDVFADAMLRMYNSEDLSRFGKSSLDRARAEFSIESTVETHLTLYRELLDESGDETSA